MAQQIISVLERVKDANGNYVLILPVNTVEEVFISLETGERLSDVLKKIITKVDDARLSTIEDLSSTINKMSGLIDDTLTLNHIYRNNFKTKDNLDISSGTYSSGSIKISQGQSMDFRLKNPIELNFTPTEFKVTEIAKYLGSPNISCLITFNALDSSPQWYDCTDVLTTGLFAKVPAIPNKEVDKKYAINIRIRCTCDSSSTFEIMDLSVLYA